MKTRKPNRLTTYDYSNPGYYFVTICVDKMKCVFGKMNNEKMKLNPYGRIVEKYLLLIADRYPNYQLDHYIVMPNHLHAIIIINDIDDGGGGVGTTHELSLPRTSLSKVLGYFKMNSSRDIHQLGKSDFKWQRSFYDRIIRNENELFNIRKYIQQNPMKWQYEDKLVRNTDF